MTVVCGSRKVDFQAFKLLHTSCTLLDIKTAGSYFHPSIVLSLYIFTYSQLDVKRGFEPLLLFVTAQVYRRCEATDPRDKIYAVLGLLGGRRQEDALAFTPDYNISTQTLYKRFTRYFINKVDPYYVLEKCGGDRQLPGLPSWAPDWTRSNLIPQLSIFCREEGPYACGNLSTAFEFSLEGNELLLEGILFSRVKRLTSVFESKNDGKFWKSIQPIALESLLLVLELDSSKIPDPGDLSESITFLEENHDNDMKKPYVGGGTKANAWSRAVCAGEPGLFESFEDGDRSPNTSLFRQVLHPKNLTDMLARMSSLLLHRRVCVSVDGYIGIAPKETEENDWICVLNGVPVPFIIREHENGYTLVGDCYVQGIMRGEAVQKIEEGVLEVQTITLI